MELRHPYRLFMVLVGTIVVWVASTMGYYSCGVAVGWSILFGYLTLLPAAALFIGSGLLWEALAE